MRSTDAAQHDRSGGRPWRTIRLASLLVAIGVAGLAASAATAQPATTPPAEAKEQARVPTSYANVHKGPSSGQVVLVLVPKDTVLPVIGRRGEWVQVRLAPELRKTGMVMRWYEDEDAGWMHDSTVEIGPITTP